jgi:hypothetical protein
MLLLLLLLLWKKKEREIIFSTSIIILYLFYFFTIEEESRYESIKDILFISPTERKFKCDETTCTYTFHRFLFLPIVSYSRSSRSVSYIVRKGEAANKT